MTTHYATDGKQCDQCEGGWQEVDDYRCSITCQDCDGGIVRDYEALIAHSELETRYFMSRDMTDEQRAEWFHFIEALRADRRGYGFYMVKRERCMADVTLEHDAATCDCKGTGTRLTLVACSVFHSPNDPITTGLLNHVNTLRRAAEVTERFSIVTVTDTGETSEVCR